MTSLATPPSPAARPESPFQLESVAFFGRSFDEYRRFFDLDPPSLRGRSVLDAAAGPSSFTAEACRQKIDAVAVDPLYGYTPAALAAHVQLDYRRMRARLRANPGMVRFRAFPSLAAADRDRSAAARRFLDDYEAHLAHGRYFGAALPQLPFFDGAFDLVLCAHLFFIYARIFDFAFHRDAARELVRVSRDEARIHPVCGADGRPYAELDRLRRELRSEGIESEIRGVDYEFFRGTDSMLVLRRQV